MEGSATEEPQGLRRFNPLRSVRRGLKAACRWTVRFGRGRSDTAAGLRRCRAGRGRAPPLASLSAAMLEPGDVPDIGDGTSIISVSGQLQVHAQVLSPHSPLQLLGTADAGSSGSWFPLVLSRPNYDTSNLSSTHAHHRRFLQYHAHVDDDVLRSQPQHLHQQVLTDDRPWTHHSPHQQHIRSCGGMAADVGCSERWLSSNTDSNYLHRSCSSSSGSSMLTNTTVANSNTGVTNNSNCSGFTDRVHSGLKEAQVLDQQEHSLQHLLAVGSRQWGSGGWWDGRGLLRVKIYDFAIYADPVKAAHALRNPATTASLEKGYRKSRTLSCDGGGGGAAATCGRPAELLVSPASRVDMSLTIRACRNLPLQMLREEFERILQRRHEKAGGRADDPALRELLSYFSRERLPEHVVVTLSSASPSPSGGGGDAVRKGASITFSRSSSGSVVTEAGGRVLGRLDSPALAEALFDLYLGDQPVSKRAKAAAGAALLDMAAATDSSMRGASGGAAPTRYSYRPQPGEKLVCEPGPASLGTGTSWGPLLDVNACLLEVS